MANSCVTPQTSGNGIHTTAIEILPGELEYKFILDG